MFFHVVILVFHKIDQALQGLHGDVLVRPDRAGHHQVQQVHANLLLIQVKIHKLDRIGERLDGLELDLLVGLVLLDSHQDPHQDLLDRLLVDTGMEPVLLA